MDPKYLALVAAVILAIIFIKHVWKWVVSLAIAAAVYWYFFVR